MGKTVDTVKDKFQNAISTLIDSNITPKIEVAVRSLNASSGRDVMSVMASSERGETNGAYCPS